MALLIWVKTCDQKIKQWYIFLKLGFEFDDDSSSSSSYPPPEPAIQTAHQPEQLQRPHFGMNEFSRMYAAPSREAQMESGNFAKP